MAKEAIWEKFSLEDIDKMISDNKVQDLFGGFVSEDETDSLILSGTLEKLLKVLSPDQLVNLVAGLIAGLGAFYNPEVRPDEPRTRDPKDRRPPILSRRMNRIVAACKAHMTERLASQQLTAA